jgi:hypothetical protein
VARLKEGLQQDDDDDASASTSSCLSVPAHCPMLLYRNVLTLLSLIVERGSRESGASCERCRESLSTRMFWEGRNSKVVQQDDDGALEHFQQQDPGHALHTSGV